MELVTFLAIVNGVDSIVTLIKFTSKWSHMYTEVLRKLERGVLVTLIGPGGARFQKKCRENSMGKFVRAVFDVLSRIEVAGIERDEARHQRRMAKLEAARAAEAKRVEAQKEEEMFKIGFLKDRLSQHYVQCDHILQMVCKGIDSKPMDDVKRAELLDLIMDLTMTDVKRFKPFEKDLLWVDVVLPLTGRPFECDRLTAPVYAVENIMMLKHAVSRMVYLNLPAIRFEHPMAM